MVKLGIVPFMNLKPLIGRYERIPDPAVELVKGPPSRLYPMLEKERLDASFVASVDYLRHRDSLHLVPNFGVATRGTVASVLLLCRKPLEEVRQILVDQRSSTSVAMLRVLLHHKFQLTPKLTATDVTGNPEAEALLVIGDRALQGYEGFDRIFDVGTEWTSWCGLPFIFGVWVSREKRFIEPLGCLLQAGWNWTAEHWEEIIQDESRRTGLSEKLVKVYLQENIQYELGRKEFEGLEHFARLLKAIEQPFETVEEIVQ